MLETERKPFTPINETDKQILASFRNFVDRNGLQNEKFIPREIIYDSGLRSIEFFWFVDKNEKFFRMIEVQIEGSILKVIARAQVLTRIDGQDTDGRFSSSIREEQVGDFIRLPLFTDSLQMRIEEAYYRVQKWNINDCHPVGARDSVKREYPKSFLGVKGFVDGI